MHLAIQDCRILTGRASGWTGLAIRRFASRCSLTILVLGIFFFSGKSLAAPNIGFGQVQDLELNSGWQLQDASLLTATGAAISTPAFQPRGWYEATVPGTVLTTLVDNNVYPEPLYGLNVTSIPNSLCLTNYWYRTTFTVPLDYVGRKIWLNFNGINWEAEVWLNGQDLGSIQAAFTRGIFDITSLVHPGQRAVLAVNIIPPPDPGPVHNYTIALQGGPNGGTMTQDNPTFVCSEGWDWMPTIPDRDIGIWQKVYLSTSKQVEIQNPYISSTLPLPSTSTADLTVQTTLNNATNAAQSGYLTGQFDNVYFTYPVTIAANTQQAVTLTPAQVPQLHVANPRLWWPNGYGPQNLYKMQLSFVANGQIADSRTVTFGIRSISYFVPNSTNLTISVNGVQIMIKGGDWGMDEALKRIPKERMAAQMRFQKEVGYNLVRNWVGQSTTDDFFDLCDENGLLVWDEFFFTNDEGKPSRFPDIWAANVTDVVLRYRNHPSLAIWCGGNEGVPPADLNNAAIAILAQYDPIRFYQPGSGSQNGVASGGPYGFQSPLAYFQKTASKSVEPFKDEIGSESIPTFEAVQGMMPAADWVSINDDWAEHNMDTFNLRMSYPPHIIARYGAYQNMADFVRKGQLANYEAYRAIYESRFDHMFNPCTAVMIWMSNPAQPSFQWQIYSYDLEPNASFFAIKKAVEPVHIQMDADTFDVSVINHTQKAVAGAKAEIVIYNSDGTLQATQTIDVTAPAGAATDLGPIVFPSTLTPVHFVKVSLLDQSKNVISDNFYWRELQTQVGNFQAMTSLPNVQLDGEVTSPQGTDRQRSQDRFPGLQGRDASDRLLLDVTLSNPTSQVAVMAHLQLRKQKSNERVLPVFYSDNYVSLLPGEKKTISIDAANADLDGQQPLVVVDGWNVTVQQVGSNGRPPGKGSAKLIQTNTNASVSSWPVTNLPIVNGAPSEGNVSVPTPTPSPTPRPTPIPTPSATPTPTT
jgi:Exo-beta-D-glucosaminidase Ig-fold domain/Glycosyl hydrolases family 2/Glycosyl hydrolases family 2, sugar binding domain/Glycosyl hydrolases family 2, TIM barrel domain